MEGGFLFMERGVCGEREVFLEPLSVSRELPRERLVGRVGVLSLDCVWGRDDLRTWSLA